jgi:co-chaperonin GroES (HSP10)
LTTWTTPDLTECNPGIEPMHINVLVAMAELPKKSAGGIIIPDATHERESWGADHARVIAVSQHAFTYAKDWTSPQPQPGDVVFVGKYAGSDVMGQDGRKYKLVTDQEIAAVIERSPKAENTDG